MVETTDLESRWLARAHGFESRSFLRVYLEKMSLPKIVQSDFNSFIHSAPKVLIEFSATWCAPCKTIEPILEKIRLEVDVKVVKVDVDEEYELAEQFKVRGVPTVLAFQDGVLVDTIVGMTNRERLLKNLL